MKLTSRVVPAVAICLEEHRWTFESSFGECRNGDVDSTGDSEVEKIIRRNLFRDRSIVIVFGGTGGGADVAIVRIFNFTILCGRRYCRNGQVIAPAAAAHNANRTHNGVATILPTDDSGTPKCKQHQMFNTSTARRRRHIPRTMSASFPPRTDYERKHRSPPQPGQ